MNKIFISLLFCALASGLIQNNLYGMTENEPALRYFYEGEYRSAKQALYKSDQWDTEQRNIFLSVIHLKLQEPDLAFDKLKEITSALPDHHVYLYYLFFKIALLKKNISLAKANIEQISRQNNPFLLRLTQLELADLYDKQNKYASAEEYYIKASDGPFETNISPRALKKLIEINIQKKDKEATLIYYQKLITYYPETLKEKDIWKNITKHVSTKSNKLKMEDVFKNENDFALFCRKLYENNMYQEAESYGEIFLSKYPKYQFKGDILAIIGQSYFAQYHYSLAIQYFTKVQKQFPQSQFYTQSLFYLGRSYESLRLYQDALNAYRTLITNEQDKTFAPKAYYCIYQIQSKTQLDKNFRSSFLEEYKNKYQDHPYYNRLIWELGWDAYEEGRLKSAIEILSQYSSLSSDISTQSKIVFWLGKINLELGNRAQAEQAFLTCLQSYPYTFQSYRIISSYLPYETISSYVKPINTYPIEEELDWLLSIGLGELALQECSYNMETSDPKTDEHIYRIAYCYKKMNNHYASIKLIRKHFNLNVYPQRDVDIQESFLPLLYPYAYENIINRYSKEFNVEPHLALALMREESMFHHSIKSRVNAIGLMQLMPYTAKDIARQLKEKWTSTEILENIHINIKYGIFYLSKLNHKFDHNPVLVLAGYNAGPSNTLKWAEQFGTYDLDVFINQIPYAETRSYTQRVLETYWIYKILY